MQAVLSHLPLAAAALASAAVVALVAVADHRHTGRVIHRADVAAWFCENRGSRCDEPKAGPIHFRWEVREYTYKATEGVLAALVVGSTMLRRRRRRHAI